MLGNLFSTGAVSSSAQIPLSFKVSTVNQLRLVSAVEAAEKTEELLQLWRLLSCHISRYPYDLQTHVQRILLTEHDSLKSRCAGSLLDLFLALNNSGITLRERMLKVCREQLDEVSYTRFSNWLEEGVSAKESGWYSGSVLATGEAPQARRLLKQQRTDTTVHYTDVLSEVQDHLEYGQIDLAQALLEREITKGRITPELEQELLTVYQHTRNRNRLEEVSIALSESGHELSESWQEIRESAKHW